MKHKYWIDSHKGLTGPFVLGLIAWYHAWDNVIAWIYLALHGTYGVLWIVKSRYFGDKNWERPVNFGVGRHSPDQIRDIAPDLPGWGSGELPGPVADQLAWPHGDQPPTSA